MICWQLVSHILWRIRWSYLNRKQLSLTPDNKLYVYTISRNIKITLSNYKLPFILVSNVIQVSRLWLIKVISYMLICCYKLWLIICHNNVLNEVNLWFNSQNQINKTQSPRVTMNLFKPKIKLTISNQFRLYINQPLLCITWYSYPILYGVI